MSADMAYDAEKGEKHDGNAVVMKGLDENSSDGTVHRSLKARHLQMIALSGTIGTGLFVGAGGSLAQGGPLGLLLGFTIMGSVIGAMMVALGEMTTLYPVSGAFTHYAARFVDPSLGFALGWNYWYSYAITLPAEITAAALVIDYWPGARNINVAVWISIFLVVIVSFNFMGVRYYGEAEFWFSVIKIVTILGLLLVGLIITCGGGPNHETIGFRYWKDPGPFQQQNGIPGAKGQFLAFWTTLINAAYSYLGTEIVALTAGEAENPRRNVPKAIKRVFARIVFFYVFGSLIIGLTVSPNNDQLLNGSGVNASPWVIAISDAGIKVLPSIINAVVLISAFSAGNSDLYASSRTLYGLACDGKAPAIFRKCTKNGLPIYCLIVTALFGLLAYMTVSSGAARVFNWLVNLSTITGLITWGCIMLSFIRFEAGCRAQGIDRNLHPFKAPFQPWLSYYGLIIVTLVTFFNGYSLFLADSWDKVTFVIDYITIPIFIVLFVFWKFWKRTRFVRVHEMDFQTGRRELDEVADAEAAKYVEPTSAMGKVWAAIM